MMTIGVTGDGGGACRRAWEWLSSLFSPPNEKSTRVSFYFINIFPIKNQKPPTHK